MGCNQSQTSKNEGRITRQTSTHDSMTGNPSPGVTNVSGFVVETFESVICECSPAKGKIEHDLFIDIDNCDTKSMYVSVDSLPGDLDTPFSVNRLISCPDLTPSLRRAVGSVSPEGLVFANVTEASLGSKAKDYNWAEHAPITPNCSSAPS